MNLEKELPRAGYHEHGHEAGVWCNDCKTWVSGGAVIHNTLGPSYPVKEAPDFDPDDLIAYSEEGDYIIYCSVCNEPGLYKLEVGTPDQPDTPDKPGNDDDENIFEKVVNGFKKAASSFINVFLRLIRWLGGKK